MSYIIRSIYHTIETLSNYDIGEEESALYNAKRELEQLIERIIDSDLAEYEQIIKKFDKA